MLAYRSFMTPQELLRRLVHRYMGKSVSYNPSLTEEENEQLILLIRIKCLSLLFPSREELSVS